MILRSCEHTRPRSETDSTCSRLSRLQAFVRTFKFISWVFLNSSASRQLSEFFILVTHDADFHTTLGSAVGVTERARTYELKEVIRLPTSGASVIEIYHYLI